MELSKKGIYHLLHTTKDIPVEVVENCITIYGDMYVNKNKSNKQKRTEEKYPHEKEKNDIRIRKFIWDCASANFGKFLKIVTEQTGVVFKPNKRKNKEYDWWEESNLDGIFAYSGCTDDF